MGHSIELSERAYSTLMALAQEQGQTPEALLEHLLETARATGRDRHDPYTNPRYLNAEEWMRHMGVSEERIRWAQQQAEAESDADADV